MQRRTCNLNIESWKCKPNKNLWKERKKTEHSDSFLPIFPGTRQLPTRDIYNQNMMNGGQIMALTLLLTTWMGIAHMCATLGIYAQVDQKIYYAILGIYAKVDQKI